MNTTNTPTITPTLKIVNGRPMASSLDIAAHFNKRHERVLNAIRSLEIPEEFAEHNFVLSEYTDPTGRKLPSIDMTRDGLTVLVMGFTGKHAMEWKLKYIEAFNRMEEQVMGALIPQDQPPFQPSPRQLPKTGQLSQGTLNFIKTWEGHFQEDSYNLEGLYRESQRVDPILSLLSCLERDGFDMTPFRRYCTTKNNLLSLYWTRLDELIFASRMSMNREVVARP